LPDNDRPRLKADPCEGPGDILDRLGLERIKGHHASQEIDYISPLIWFGILMEGPHLLELGFI